VLVAADVGLHAALLQQGLHFGGLVQHLAGPVAALADAEQGQVPHHQPQPCLTCGGAGQLPARPGQLPGRDAAGAGIPHQPEHLVLQNAVVEGEGAAVHEAQPQALAARQPEAPYGLAIGREAGGAVVVAHRRQKRHPRLAHRRQHRAAEGLPHRIQPGGAEARLLTGHHVAGAHDQGRPASQQLPQSLGQRGDVGGGAVAAVEVADQAQPQIGRCRESCGGRAAWRQQPAAAAQSGGGELQQLAAVQGHQRMVGG
jgi:hypothetical protein